MDKTLRDFTMKNSSKNHIILTHKIEDSQGLLGNSLCSAGLLREDNPSLPGEEKPNGSTAFLPQK